jgi:NADH-quinone oxidoreductase subunit C
MSPEQVGAILREAFPTVDLRLSGGHPHALVPTAKWLAVARFLRDDPRLQFNVLRCLTGMDLLDEGKLACVYDLMHIPLDQPTVLITTTSTFAVRVEVDRADPRVPSVAEVWPAAEWHEREAYDLVGILFENHPDPRRILLPDDWEGHPLRKDYEYPVEYHGIPGTTEYDSPNPMH